MYIVNIQIKICLDILTNIFRNTCRALFEKHKLLFSFHMCIKILNAQGKIVAGEYAFLLKGGVVLDRENQMENPCSGKNMNYREKN